MGGPGEMAKLATFFVSSGSPRERSAQDALWALYRRSGEPNELKAAIEGQWLARRHPRRTSCKDARARRALARSPGPTADTLIAEPTPTGEGDPIFPTVIGWSPIMTVAWMM